MTETESNGKLESNPRFDHWVKRYVEMRDKITAAEKAFEEKLKPDKELKNKVEAKLLHMLDKHGAEMVRTSSGTVSALLRQTTACSDPDAFMEFVVENDAIDLMDRRPNKTACLEYAETHDGMLPPGVKLNSQRYIGVKK